MRGNAFIYEEFGGFGDEPEEGAVDESDEKQYEGDGPGHVVVKKAQGDPPEPEEGEEGAGKEPGACTGRQQEVEKEQAKQGVEPRMCDAKVCKVEKCRSCHCNGCSAENVGFGGVGAA